jgi:hypothetical protein
MSNQAKNSKYMPVPKLLKCVVHEMYVLVNHFKFRYQLIQLIVPIVMVATHERGVQQVHPMQREEEGECSEVPHHYPT